MEGIYIGGRSIRTFGAKLRTDYTISGASPSRTLRREPRSAGCRLGAFDPEAAHGFLRRQPGGDRMEYGGASGPAAKGDGD